MEQPQRLQDWRAAMLASVPAYSAYLYATPAKRYDAGRAAPYLDVPPDEPLARPAPVWLHRPPDLGSASCFLDRHWRGLWFVSNGEHTIEFHAYNGRRVKRMPGRHTKHGRLDVEASAARFAAYEHAEAEHKAARDAFIADTMSERTEQAVRLGAGWMLVSGVKYYPGPRWIIFDPECGLWRVVGVMTAGITPAEVETLTIIKRGPPPRERAPVLIMSEVRAAVEPHGYTVEIGDIAVGMAKRGLVLRVKWGSVHLLSLYPDDNGQIACIEFRHAATRASLWAVLRDKTAAEIAYREEQAQKLLAEVAILREAPTAPASPPEPPP